MIETISQCAVLIPSCDAYADLWTPFFRLWNRHWPNCPFKVYLGANTKTFANSGVTTLHSRPGLKWGEQMRGQLEEIAEPIILLWLEDFFLRSAVPNDEVCRLLSDFDKMGAHMLRLVKRPGPRYLLSHKNYGPCLPGDGYRVSTQAALWRRSTLHSLIEPQESIWNFEIDGSKRSSRYADGFLSVGADVAPYGHHVVQKGKWFPWEAYRFKRLNIGCDFSARPIMSFTETLHWSLRKLVGVSGLKQLLKPAGGS